MDWTNRIDARVFTFVAFLCVDMLCCGRARADCFEQAAHYQGVNAQVLRAIAWQESRGHPDALHHNLNGTIDYGQMQINSTHLPTLARFGVTRRTLMDPCRSAFIGAWHLRRMMEKYGNTWAAIGAYHSETPMYRDSYARSVKRIIESDLAFARFDSQRRRNVRRYEAVGDSVASGNMDD